MSTAQADVNSGPQDPSAETDKHITTPAWYDDIPAWGISLLAHGAILLALTSISWVIVTETTVDLVSEVPLDKIIAQEYVIDTEINQIVGTNSPLKIDGSSLAVASNRGLETNPEELQHIEEQVNPTLPMMTTLPVPSEAELLEDINLMGTTEHAGGTAGHRGDGAAPGGAGRGEKAQGAARDGPYVLSGLHSQRRRHGRRGALPERLRR